MTAKKKFNFKAPLEVFAKSIVQPMMYLSVAGILLIVGIILTNKTSCAWSPYWAPVRSSLWAPLSTSR